MRLILYVLIGVLLLCGVSAYSVINTFTDGTTSGNITYNYGVELPTKTINVPSYSSITNAILYLNGYNYSKSLLYHYIRQGMNHTTYVGLKDVYDDYDINNPEYFNDGYNSTDATFIRGAGGRADFFINFSISNYDTITGVNVYLYYNTTTVQPQTNAIYCKNSSVTYTKAFVNSTVTIKLADVPGTAGIKRLVNYTVSPACWNNSQQIGFYFNTDAVAGNPYIYYSEMFLYINGTDSDFPHNVTVFMNNQSTIFSYGTTNNSALDHRLLANMTTNFNNSPISLWNLTFHSNTSGILEYSGLSVWYDRNFTFNFYNERDGTVYDVNRTNSTTLSVECPTNRTEYNVSKGTQNVVIGCDYTQLKVAVKQNDEDYYRTRTTQFSFSEDPTIDWYLVNLNNDSIVEVILILNDLTGGRWARSSVQITRPVLSNTEIITEQDFDVDRRVYLYLMKDALYTMTITNDAGETFTGTFIASKAEERTVTLPGMGWYSTGQYWEDDIRLTWAFDAPTGWLNLTFQDKGGLTTYANFTITNSTSGSIIYTTTSTANFTNGVTFYFNDPTKIYGNESYTADFYFNHPSLGWSHVRKNFGDYSGSIPRTGWSDGEYASITKWFTYIFLVILILSFGQATSHYGLVICFIFMVFFKAIGWLDWVGGAYLFALIGLIAVVNWYRREEVSIG